MRRNPSKNNPMREGEVAHLFGLDIYENRGGLGDYIGSYPTVEAAVKRGMQPASKRNGYRGSYSEISVAVQRNGKLVEIYRHG